MLLREVSALTPVFTTAGEMEYARKAARTSRQI